MSSNIKKRSAGAPDARAEAVKTGKSIGDRLTRNIAIATLLLLTVVGIRESSPNGQGFLKAVQSVVESEWDQNVGKLTYVSSTLADSLQVFQSSSKDDPLMTAPVSADVLQAWSAAEPCLVYQNPGSVYASARGEVTQIAHDDNGYTIVHLTHANGINTLYYGLTSCLVQEGDAVQSDTLLGRADDSFAFEMRKNGKPVDCSALLAERRRLE